MTTKFEKIVGLLLKDIERLKVPKNISILMVNVRFLISSVRGSSTS